MKNRTLTKDNSIREENLLISAPNVEENMIRCYLANFVKLIEKNIPLLNWMIALECKIQQAQISEG